jgi:hypothetical protein
VRTRREFLLWAAAATAHLEAANAEPARVAADTAGIRPDGSPDQRGGRPRGSEFVFARLYEWRNKRFLREDNTKFAVNIVVYAMT